MTGRAPRGRGRDGLGSGSAEYIVGTSAGSMIGALLACGVPPWFMVAHSSGEQLRGVADARGEPASGADRSAGASFKLHRGAPALGPGSWRLALSSLARPYRYSPAALLAGWLPSGPISTEPLKDTVRRACAEPWAPHPNYWAVAVDYQTAGRVAFGSDGAPPARAARCGGRLLCDPRLLPRGRDRRPSLRRRRTHSASNLDILEDERLDLVIALNPMSSLHTPPRARWASGSPSEQAELGQTARQRGQPPAGTGHRGDLDPADGARSRRDGHKPHEPQPAPRGDRDGRRDDD